MDRRAQVGLAGAGKLAEEAKKAEDLLPAAPKSERRLQARRKRRTAEPIEILQTDVAQSRGDFFGVIELRRRAFGHRPTGVDQQVNIHLFLGGKHFQEQPLEAPVDIPVDVTQIVAVLIAAVIGKFQAKTFARGGMLALGAGPAQPLGDQMKPFELAQEFGVEKSLGFRVSGFGLTARKGFR